MIPNFVADNLPMRKLFLLAIGILFSVNTQAQVSTKATSSANKLGWQLAVHSYTFQKFPILDAIDMTAALGVKYMSISGTVLLDGKRIGTLTLADEQRATIDQKLKAKGLGHFVNMGVVKLPADEAECRRVFEFAKKWGIGTLVSEPETNALDTVEKLCKEYNIKVAIHNHPKDHSIYWSPDLVLAAIKGDPMSNSPLEAALESFATELAEAARVAEQILAEGWPLTYAAFVKNGRVGP